MNVARVRDVMSEAVVFVNAGISISEAAEILTRHRINGAPVIGDRGRVVGVVSKTDLLDVRRQPDDRLELVEDAMTRVVFAVRAEDPAIMAVHLMVQEDIHRALVVNEDGTLAGIVAPMDVLRGIAKGMLLGERGQHDPVGFVDLRRQSVRPKL